MPLLTKLSQMELVGTFLILKHFSGGEEHCLVETERL